MRPKSSCCWWRNHQTEFERSNIRFMRVIVAGTVRPNRFGKFTTCLAKTPEGISDAARRVAPVELAGAVGKSQILNPDAVARTDVTLEYEPTVG